MKRFLISLMLLLACSLPLLGQTTTTNFGFNIPSNGTVNWDSLLNTNFSSMDTYFLYAAFPCADSSGSGTAQVCNTSPVFTPVAHKTCINYTTTTQNSGTALTVNVNSLGAKSVAKYVSSTTLAAGDIPANKDVMLCYDGTNWEMNPSANAPSGTGSPTACSNQVVTSFTLVASAAPTSTCTSLTNSFLPSAPTFVTSATSPIWNATGSLPASSTTGIYNYGTLGFSDSNQIQAFQGSVNNYLQNVLQNTNAGAAASTDYVVGNNNTTATTYYGDFGINGGGFTGVGSYSIPNATYLAATTGELVLGTTTQNNVHFFLNNGAKDAALISPHGLDVQQMATADTMQARTMTPLAEVGILSPPSFHLTASTPALANYSVGRTRGVCVIDNDTQSATALTAAQLSGKCVIPAAATIVEVDVSGGTQTINGTPTAPTYTGTSSVQVGIKGAQNVTSIMSAALATASGVACAVSMTAQTCLFNNGMTSSATIRLSDTQLAAGDELYVSGATADGAQTWYNVSIIYTVN